jgi:hypothetical protein
MFARRKRNEHHGTEEDDAFASRHGGGRSRDGGGTRTRVRIRSQRNPRQLAGQQLDVRQPGQLRRRPDQHPHGEEDEEVPVVESNLLEPHRWRRGLEGTEVLHVLRVIPHRLAVS